MFEKIKRNINHPEKIIIKLGKISRLIPDKLYLQAYYYNVFEKKLDLKCPKTFNEKLQWLKLYDRQPEYTMMVDKYMVREYVAKQIGAEYLIPLLGVWNDPDDIDFESLPNQFVLKCNHNSAVGMCICKDKSKLDINKVKEGLRKGLTQDYYLSGREWPYKDVTRKIICEKYMTDSKSTDVSDYKIQKDCSFTADKEELRDYKFFCFNGKVKCFKIDFDRFVNHKANYFSRSKELLPFGECECPPDYSRKLKLPDKLDEMIFLAEKLAYNHQFLRVDFYDVNGKIYFGELTFFPASGFGPFYPEEWDLTLGETVRKLG